AGYSMSLLCFVLCLHFFGVSRTWSNWAGEPLTGEQVVRSSALESGSRSDWCSDCWAAFLSLLPKTLPSDRHPLIFGLLASFMLCLGSRGSFELPVDFAGLKISWVPGLRRPVGRLWKC